MFNFKQSSQAEQDIISGLQLTDFHKTRAEEKFFKQFVYFVREGSQKFNLTEAEAFDAYADSILAVLDDIANNTFTGSASLKTYTYSIFKNKCVDLFRKKTTNKNSVHQRVLGIEGLAELSDNARSVLHKLSDQADLDLLEQKLNELGISCRQLLVNTAEGKSDREIAELMQFKTTDVVKSTRLRCLSKLRALYRILK